MITLGPGASSAGHRIEQVPAIGSTNAALVERAGKGETGPLWLVADSQDQGRGRNARSWTSPQGNLYASLLLTNPAPAANVAQLSFVLSLALREAVLAAAGMTESPTLTLKWPNDLMAEGRKTAGLLLEGGQHDGVGFVVAGFGVNIVSHPEGTTHPATNLAAAGFAVDRDRLATALTDTVANRLIRWHRGAGFPGIRADWLKAAHGLGATLRVNMVAESFEGTFDTIDPAGRLVVITPTGNRLVSAGDVFVLGTAA